MLESFFHPVHAGNRIQPKLLSSQGIRTSRGAEESFSRKRACHSWCQFCNQNDTNHIPKDVVFNQICIPLCSMVLEYSATCCPKNHLHTVRKYISMEHMAYCSYPINLPLGDGPPLKMVMTWGCLPTEVQIRSPHFMVLFHGANALRQRILGQSVADRCLDVGGNSMENHGLLPKYRCIIYNYIHVGFDEKAILRKWHVLVDGQKRHFPCDRQWCLRMCFIPILSVGSVPGRWRDDPCPWFPRLETGWSCGKPNAINPLSRDGPYTIHTIHTIHSQWWFWGWFVYNWIFHIPYPHLLMFYWFYPKVRSLQDHLRSEILHIHTAT